MYTTGAVRDYRWSYDFASPSLVDLVGVLDGSRPGRTLEQAPGRTLEQAAAEQQAAATAASCGECEREGEGKREGEGEGEGLRLEPSLQQQATPQEQGWAAPPPPLDGEAELLGVLPALAGRAPRADGPPHRDHGGEEAASRTHRHLAHAAAAPRRRNGPLLPAACAMALLPRGGRRHAASALRHLMDPGSPVEEIYTVCEECSRLGQRISAVGREFDGLRRDLQVGAGPRRAPRPPGVRPRAPPPPPCLSCDSLHEPPTPSPASSPLARRSCSSAWLRPRHWTPRRLRRRQRTC